MNPSPKELCEVCQGEGVAFLSDEDRYPKPCPACQIPTPPTCDGKSQCADMDCEICGNREFTEKALGRKPTPPEPRCEKCKGTGLVCAYLGGRCNGIEGTHIHVGKPCPSCSPSSKENELYETRCPECPTDKLDAFTPEWCEKHSTPKEKNEEWENEFDELCRKPISMGGICAGNTVYTGVKGQNILSHVDTKALKSFVSSLLSSHTLSTRQAVIEEAIERVEKEKLKANRSFFVADSVGKKGVTSGPISQARIDGYEAGFTHALSALEKMKSDRRRPSSPV